MNVQDYYGRNVVSTDGAKIGSVSNVFVDEGTDNPEWVTVKTGLFGSHEAFVPVAGGAISGDDLVVPFTKDQVKDAPHYDTTQNLTEDDEAQLYSHYRMARTAGYADLGSTLQDHSGHDHAEGMHDHGTDDAMTRSEERLHVGTEKVQTGKARLRKYIVTEQVTQTVPVTREEIRVVREPITDADRGPALVGAELTTEEHEITLTEERVIVSKETVPVERVRLTKDVITGEEQVEETLRHEEIVTEGVEDSTRLVDGSADITADKHKRH